MPRCVDSGLCLRSFYSLFRFLSPHGLLLSISSTGVSGGLIYRCIFLAACGQGSAVCGSSRAEGTPHLSSYAWHSHFLSASHGKCSSIRKVSQRPISVIHLIRQKIL